MPAPLSSDIRNRFQVLHRKGLSAPQYTTHVISAIFAGVFGMDFLHLSSAF